MDTPWISIVSIVVGGITTTLALAAQVHMTYRNQTLQRELNESNQKLQLSLNEQHHKQQMEREKVLREWSQRDAKRKELKRRYQALYKAAIALREEVELTETRGPHISGDDFDPETAIKIEEESGFNPNELHRELYIVGWLPSLLPETSGRYKTLMNSLLLEPGSEQVVSAAKRFFEILEHRIRYIASGDKELDDDPPGPVDEKDTYRVMNFGGSDWSLEPVEDNIERELTSLRAAISKHLASLQRDTQA